MPRILNPIALAIQAVAETVTGLAVYPHETFAQGLRVPALTIGAVDFTRPDVDEPETQVGSFDRDMTWALTLYVALDDPASAYAASRDLIDDLLDAFDDRPTLNGQVQEAKLVAGESGVNTADAARRLIVVEMDLDVFALVPA